MLYFSEHPSRISKRCSFSSFRYLPPLKKKKKLGKSFSGKSLFILSRPLFHHAVSLIYFHPSPHRTFGHRFSSCILSFKPALQETTQPPSSLSAATCDENPDLIIIRCHGAPRHTLAELSRYPGRARREGRAAGVLGALRRKYDGSCCLLLCCVIGALVHL